MGEARRAPALRVCGTAPIHRDRLLTRLFGLDLPGGTMGTPPLGRHTGVAWPRLRSEGRRARPTNGLWY